MKLLGLIACLFRGHKYMDAWQISPQKTCVEVDICERCHRKKRRLAHSWHISNQTCFCNDCGFSPGSSHKFEGPWPKSDTTHYYRCIHCNFEKVNACSWRQAEWIDESGHYAWGGECSSKCGNSMWEGGAPYYP